MNSKKTKLALFDIDGTIFRSSLLIQINNALIKEGIFPQQAAREIEPDHQAWFHRQGTYEAYISKAVLVHIRYIKGAKKQVVSRIAKKIITAQKNRTYIYTRDLMRKLKKEHYHLIALSGSPFYIASAFAKAMKFNDVFGSTFEVINGIFTGKLTTVLEQEKKVDQLKLFLDKKNIIPDFKHSIAVGDTEGDIPMLSLVGNPVAFNPNRKLMLYARSKKWKIIVERKDVIYTLKDFKI